MKKIMTELGSLLRSKLVIGAGVCCLTFIVLSSHTNRPAGPETPMTTRTIEVTGSSEMEVVPDEIEFVIGLSEYYEEEFKVSKVAVEYKKKVMLEGIEKEVRAKLAAAGIPADAIKTQGIGNYWRYQGRAIEVSKELRFCVSDFSIIEKLLPGLEIRGVNYMQIGRLSNKKITEFRRTVKTDALKAAEEKAAYLLNGIGKKTVQILSVREVSEGSPYWYSNASNSISNSAYAATDNDNNFRTIKLRYEVEATYEIAN